MKEIMKNFHNIDIIEGGFSIKSSMQKEDIEKLDILVQNIKSSL
jgi:hypothetical protein